jgi:hypothetical protein
MDKSSYEFAILFLSKQSMDGLHNEIGFLEI